MIYYKILTVDDYKAISHTIHFQRNRFARFVNSVTKRRKYKPSRHIVSDKKKPYFGRMVFNKKGF